MTPGDEFRRRDGEAAGNRSGLSRLALGAVAVTALAVLVWFTIDVFLLIFSGILLAIFLRSLSNWLHARTPLGQGPALVVAVLALVVVLGGSLWLAGRQVATQVDELIRGLPAALERTEQQLAATWWGPFVLEQLPHEATLTGAQSVALSSVAQTTSVIMRIVTYTSLILFFGLFLAVSPDLYWRGVLHLLPPGWRDRAGEVAAAVGEALETYVLAKVSSMITSGLLATLGLWLLGLPLAVPLGVLMGLLTFIPVVGPLLALVPALLLALLQGPFTALAVAALYLGIQGLHTYVLKPVFYQQTLSIPPALILGAQVLLGLLVGSLGVVLASPLAITIWVLVRLLYVEDRLGDAITAEAEAPPAG